jgi:hypothetical protein
MQTEALDSVPTPQAREAVGRRELRRAMHQMSREVDARHERQVVVVIQALGRQDVLGAVPFSIDWNRHCGGHQEDEQRAREQSDWIGEPRPNHDGHARSLL